MPRCISCRAMLEIGRRKCNGCKVDKPPRPREPRAPRAPRMPGKRRPGYESNGWPERPFARTIPDYHRGLLDACPWFREGSR